MCWLLYLVYLRILYRVQIYAHAGTIGEEDPRALTSRWLLPKALSIPARPPERLLG